MKLQKKVSLIFYGLGRGLFEKGKETLQKCFYNLQLNGDWKRQSFYCPSLDEMARIARYHFVCDWGYPSDLCNSQNSVDISHFDGTIPTLVMEGSHDLTWNPTRKPAAIQSIHPHAKLITFNQSAHSPFADEPQAFFKALGNFLNSNNIMARTAESCDERRKAADKVHQ